MELFENSVDGTVDVTVLEIGTASAVINFNDGVGWNAQSFS